MRFIYCFFVCGLSTLNYLPYGVESRSTGRIIGGTPARAGLFPFAAAIHIQTSNSRFFCSGSLTGNDWVITSGHCVYNAVLFTVQLGSHHLETEDESKMIVATSTFILHPDFNPDTIEHDIGIIQFRRPIDYTIYINPIYPASWVLSDDAMTYAMGWGQTSDNDAGLTDELHYARIRTISNLECQMFYGNQITDNMVCAIGNYNEGTCTGDNGSPLAVSSGKYFALVGVASFISANGCESTNPSGYTRTYPYREWIANNTRLPATA